MLLRTVRFLGIKTCEPTEELAGRRGRVKDCIRMLFLAKIYVSDNRRVINKAV
jgi:hypothetical protein